MGITNESDIQPRQLILSAQHYTTGVQHGAYRRGRWALLATCPVAKDHASERGRRLQSHVWPSRLDVCSDNGRAGAWPTTKIGEGERAYWRPIASWQRGVTSWLLE